MNKAKLLSVFTSDPRIAAIAGAGPGSRIFLKGLIGSSRSFYGAGVYETGSILNLFILPDKEAAAYFFNDIEEVLEDKNLPADKKKVLFFPSSFKKDDPAGKKDNQGLLARTEVLNRMFSKSKKCILVSYPEALSEKVVNREYLEKNTLHLLLGEAVSLDFVLDLLIEYEFERTDFVVEPGQFSLRGGLIDVFSFGGEYPYRIEFEGNRVASLRSFEPATQLSVEKMEEITIIPDVRIRPEKKIRFDPLFEFFPTDSAVWIDDAATLREITIPDESGRMFLEGPDLLKTIGKFTVLEMGKQRYFREGKEIRFEMSPQPSFHKNFDLLFNNLLENSRNGFKNILFADNPKQNNRLKTILEDIGEKHEPVPQENIDILNLSIHEGFIDKNLKIACYTDHEIFERYHHYQLRDGYSSQEALKLKDLYDLKPGDYVTHIDHGVGRFDGLEKIVNNGREQEAIRLIYKNNDILYVSIHSLHRISKYIGKEGTPPVLNRLGSDAWTRLKNRTKSKVKDIARDLINLYAKRRSTEGYSYAPDSYLQTELEASFLYEDTPDQIKATRDVKKDLEATFPMDRLICGDVGFGKTEIAIRAAFKVVSESRQVAVLVPTTILALQHYKTFSERLKDFPCTINYINRFKTASERKQILNELEEGKLDIIIGTHRLLSKDVHFKNLGLLIIDEE
ncbi:MAG: CarD family transcriptional regulator, partial [Bacteroidota bacterium]|nr:CarD family transcriptional regulator [Bacteroidota bacterium]